MSRDEQDAIREEREKIARGLEDKAQGYIDSGYEALDSRKRKRRLECANKSQVLKEAAREIRDGAYGEESREN